MADTQDTASLRLRLKEILYSVNNPSAPNLLSLLLASPSIFSAISSDQECRDLLSQIATYFQDAEPRYFAFCTIQKALGSPSISIRQVKSAGLSLHSIKGNFLWCQKKCAVFYGRDKYEIRDQCLFDLMDKHSRERIFMKFGPNLLDMEQRKEVVINYTVEDVNLVSKCVLVYYSTGTHASRFGILLRTRKSRKADLALLSPSYPPLQDGCGFIDSALKSDPPLTPSFLTLTDSELLQTPLSEFHKGLRTPSPSFWTSNKHDLGDELRLTSFSITPLLSSADEPNCEKRQKMMTDIREFTP